VAVAIALLQVVQSSSFANTGQQIQRLELEKQSRTAEIRDMEAQVAALSSLDRIERSARNQLGMVPAARIEHISVNAAAPGVPLLPRPILNPVRPAAPATEPWWQSLFKALPLPRKN
jgi:cell division protein FtsL